VNKVVALVCSLAAVSSGALVDNQSHFSKFKWGTFTYPYLLPPRVVDGLA